VNTLLGKTVQRTGSIREDDSKGRHITTGRSLHLIPTGGMLMDTPGMRELQLANCDQGVITTFADITALSAQCRFADCRHDSEPGCAVQGAISRNELSARRLSSFQKLMREQAFNSATLAEKRARDRQFSKMIKNHMSNKKNRKG
jgi:ribosome biogenesis GTPase